MWRWNHYSIKQNKFIIKMNKPKLIRSKKVLCVVSFVGDTGCKSISYWTCDFAYTIIMMRCGSERIWKYSANVISSIWLYLFVFIVPFNSNFLLLYNVLVGSPYTLIYVSKQWSLKCWTKKKIISSSLLFCFII